MRNLLKMNTVQVLQTVPIKEQFGEDLSNTLVKDGLHKPTLGQVLSQKNKKKRIIIDREGWIYIIAQHL